MARAMARAGEMLVLTDLPIEVLTAILARLPATVPARAAQASRSFLEPITAAVIHRAAHLRPGPGWPVLPDRLEQESMCELLHFIEKMHSNREHRRISCGWGVTYIIDSDGKAFVCGGDAHWDNEECAHLGIGHMTHGPLATLTPMVGLSVRVVEVAAGNGHALLRSSVGNVYSVGGEGGEDKQDRAHFNSKLGHADLAPSTVPRRIEAIARAVNVAAGNMCSLVVLRDGTLLSFGTNLIEGGANCRGLLAREVNTPVIQSTIPPAWRRQHDARPGRVQDLEHVHVVQACAGRNFCVCLDSDGAVYTWGENTEGVLGQGNLEHADIVFVERPRRIVELSSIVQISAGAGHALATDSAGQVYGWGSPEQGKLGRPLQQPDRLEMGGRYRPAILTSLQGERVVQTACGSCASSFITAAGDLIVYGTLGTGELFDPPLTVATMTDELLWPVRQIRGVSHVAMGPFSTHAVALDSTSTTVYAWGDGDYGQLGSNDMVDRDYGQPMALPPGFALRSV